MPASNQAQERKKPAARKKSPAGKKAPATKKKAAGRKAKPVKPAAISAASKGGDGYSRAAMEAAKRRKTNTAGPSEQPLMKALRAEHRHMATVMQLFVDQLKALEDGQGVDAHVLYEVMDYMVSWPDRYHHPREDLIYSRVAELDPKAADEVDTLQRDHDRTAEHGRQLLRDIQAWRDGAYSAGKLVKAGRAYVDHRRSSPPHHRPTRSLAEAPSRPPPPSPHTSHCVHAFSVALSCVEL